MRLILAAGAIILVGIATVAGAKAETVIRLQTAMAAGSFTLDYLNTNWVPKLEAMTSGSLKLEILPSKAAVPHRETPGAVAAGILQGDLNAISYFADKDPGFGLMGDLISGYDTTEQMQMFCRFGGGIEVLQKLYDKLYPGKIHVIGCGPFSKEALVSTVPIRTVADFKGLKIRAPEGMAADVFRRVGAIPTAIPLTDLHAALERKLVDAADASSYANNDSLGYYKFAKYPIFPGIHSMAVLQFVVNEELWKKIGPHGQAALEAWYLAAWTDTTRASDLEDRKLAAMAGNGDHGIHVIDWTAEERAKFRKIAEGVWAEEAAKSELAKAAYDAHIAFMKRYGLFR